MAMLKVTVTKKSEGIFVVSPAGPVDSDTYIVLQKKVDDILKPVPKAVVFDMQGVTYISSLGIKVFLRTREIVQRGGGTVLMMNLQPQIAKVFDIVKAIPSQNIFSSTEEMDHYLTSIQQKEIEKGKSF
jgi:anti-sigma B factor antagonist